MVDLGRLKKHSTESIFSGLVLVLTILIISELSVVLISFNEVFGSILGVPTSLLFIWTLIFVIGLLYRLSIDVSTLQVAVGSLCAISVYLLILYIEILLLKPQSGFISGYISAQYISVICYVVGSLVGKKMQSYVTESPKYSGVTEVYLEALSRI